MSSDAVVMDALRVNRQNFTRNRTKYDRIQDKAKRLHKINEGRKLNDEAQNQHWKFGQKNKIISQAKNYYSRKS